MSTSAYGSEIPITAKERPEAGMVAEIAGMWWIWLITGAAWCFTALIILQFERASVATVGVIVGLMFMAASLQQFTLASTVDHLRWLAYIFGALFFIAGVLALIRPVNTFAGLADMLGFLFLLFGIWWTIEPFALKRAGRPLWWFGFISGPLMILTAFWTSGQFFFEKAYILLVFAGIWALLHGVSDIIRAFQARLVRASI